MPFHKPLIRSVPKHSYKKRALPGAIAHPNPEDQIWDNCGNCAILREDRRDRYVDYYKSYFWCEACRFKRFKKWHADKHYPHEKEPAVPKGL